jgi:hypothetical protein
MSEQRIEALHLVALSIDVEQSLRGTKKHARAVKLFEESKTLWKEQLVPRCPHCGKPLK